MKIEAEVDYATLFELFGKPPPFPKPGMTVALEDHGTLQIAELTERRGADIAPVLVKFLIHVAEGASAGVLAMWLWKRLGKKASKVRFENIEVELTPNGFTRVLQQKLEIEE